MRKPGRTVLRALAVAALPHRWSEPKKQGKRFIENAIVPVAVAGTATPNVAGSWEGTWSHRHGSGQITLRLAQEGTKVTGRQSVVGVTPLFGAQSCLLGSATQVMLATRFRATVGQKHHHHR